MKRPLNSRKLKPAEHKAWKIVTNYKNLLYYDEPILFTGRNAQGVRIVASSVDYVDGVNSYFYLILTDEEYALFKSGKITYAECMRLTNHLFLVHLTDSPDSRTYSYRINWQYIPEKYRPTEQSFFPTS